MYKLFQFLPNFKGKLRLAKYFFNNQDKPITFTIKNNIYFTVPNIIENISFELLINGIYEKNVLNIINNHLPLNSVFIDVGDKFLKLIKYATKIITLKDVK